MKDRKIKGTDGFVRNHSFTVTCWIKPNFASGAANDHTIAGQIGNGLHLTLRNRQPYMGFFGNDLRCRRPLNDGQWTHIAYVYNVSSRIQEVFINGESAGKRGARPLGNRGDVVIGYWHAEHHNSHFNGLIGTVTISNYPYSKDEVANCMAKYIEETDGRFEKTIQDALAKEAREEKERLEREAHKLFGKDHHTMHIPNIQKQSSEEVVDHWTENRVKDTICPEYMNAYNTMIISPHFMGRTSSQSFMKRLQDDIKAHPLKRSWDEQLTLSIMKAWKSRRQDVKRVNSTLSEIECGNVYHESTKFYNHVKSWQKPLVIRALEILTDREGPSSLQTILALMIRAGRRCSSTKVFAFGTLLARGSNFLQGEGDLKPTVDMGKNSTAPIVDEKEDDDDDDVEKARVVLQRELMKYLDTVKSRAFQSVFLEPAKFHIGGDHDVEIHGANYYGAVLCSTLGVRCPRLIHASDWCRGGLVTFLDNGVDPAIKNTLWKDENFGKSYFIIKGRPTKHVTRGRFVFDGTPKQIANSAVEAAASRSRERKRISAYLDQFAHYFSKSFLLEKLIVRLLRDGTNLSHLKILFSNLLSQIDGVKTDLVRRKTDSIKSFLYDDETYKLKEGNAILLLRCIGKVLREPDLLRVVLPEDRDCLVKFLEKEEDEEEEKEEKEEEKEEDDSDWVLVDTSKEKQLKAIAAELQRAMASQDRALIRKLMQKRRELQSKE